MRVVVSKIVVQSVMLTYEDDWNPEEIKKDIKDHPPEFDKAAFAESIHIGMFPDEEPTISNAGE